MDRILSEPFFRILRDAGWLMLSADHPRVEAKAGHANYVTETDRAVQDYLEERFAAMLPGVRFLAEEAADGQKALEGCVLVIDPIDGTTNFFRGRRASVISVGVTENGKVTAGAIWDPYRQSMYHAERGCGAWRNDERIRVTDRPIGEALIGFGTAPYYPELMHRTARAVDLLLPAVCDLRRSGSSATDLCQTAEGTLDAMFEWRLQPWDICAGIVLVEEAGGRCGRIEGGAPVLTGGAPFMAANARCFDALQDLLQKSSGFGT